MSNLSTTNLPKAGGGEKKTLVPGNQTCKIASVELIPFTLKPGAFELRLNMVGPDMPAPFEGFFIDKNNESLGRHKGQVGRVKATEWAFADGVTKGGTVISRDTEIMKWINSFCEAIGKKEWMTAQDQKHATIESLVNAFAMDKPFKGLDINFCIGGREYQTKEGGYTNYDLFLPKFSKEGVPFELVGTAKSRLLKYDETKHIVKKKVSTVSNFSGNGDLGADSHESPGSAADFEL